MSGKKFVRLFNKLYMIFKNKFYKKGVKRGGSGTRGGGAQTRIHPQSTLPLLCKPSKKCFALQMLIEPAGTEVILLSTEEDTQQKSQLLVLN